MTIMVSIANDDSRPGAIIRIEVRSRGASYEALADSAYELKGGEKTVIGITADTSVRICEIANG